MNKAEIIASTIKMLDDQFSRYDKGSDLAKRNRAVYYALTHLNEWQPDINLIEKEQFRGQATLSVSTVAEWLDDESLVSEEFYNAAYDLRKKTPNA